MEFLQKALLEKAGKYAGRTADNDEDKEVLQSSAKAVHQSGVATPQESDIHEASAVHDKVYQQGNTSDATDEELGKAAGVQAFKAYESSESKDDDSDDEDGGSGGGGQGKLVQMAMAEAMKMFSGGGGKDKSTVVQSAIAMAMQLFAGKSGAGGGGVAQLMGMLTGGGKKGGDDDDDEDSGKAGGMMGMLGQAASNPQVASMLQSNPQVAGLLGKFM